MHNLLQALLSTRTSGGGTARIEGFAGMVTTIRIRRDAFFVAVNFAFASETGESLSCGANFVLRFTTW